MKVCPAGALDVETKGYRVLLGGKLGRHPQLATEIEGIHTRDRLLDILEKCVDHYIAHGSDGERFGEVLGKTGLNFLNNCEGKPQKNKKNENC
jgi:dissimilatory sulfite reductase (desulfoviridin) alpha/beta subunit